MEMAANYEDRQRRHEEWHREKEAMASRLKDESRQIEEEKE